MLFLCFTALFYEATPLYSQTPDNFNPSIGGTPLALAVQPDAKVFVVGNFTNIAGQARFNNSRLNPDGTFDSSYFAGGTLYPIRAVGLAANGDIFLGGDFYLYGGVERPYLIRVTSGGGVGIFGTWPNGPVRALAIQPDGKLVVGGDFSSIGGIGRNCLARLNADNTVDSTFNPIANGSIYSLALQTDGKILVGGAFTSIAGMAATNLARLNPDGTFDSSFNALVPGLPNVLLVQPDGKILVGGDYLNTPSGVNYCRRFNTDGSLDTSFSPVLTHATSPAVYAMALQTDGKILVGGTFDTLSGVACTNLGRLMPDGSIDSNFNAVAGPVHALALQPDGRVLFGAPAQLSRLMNTEPATENLVFDNSSATLSRGGTAPEVWCVTFAFTTNGIDWLNLSNGVRTAGGWQCTGFSLPSVPVIIRARGYVAGGNWFDEQFAGPPIITSQPPNRTVRNALTSVTFSAAAIGAGQTYLWLKNGAVFNPTNGAGAQSASLTLTNLLAADDGQYELVFSNSWGSVTSQVANLIVNDPVLISQPVSVITNAGRTVNFSIGAAGTPPLSYQWFKSNAALPNAIGPTLTFTNVQPADAANYFVIFTNQYGSRTSSIVTLSVNTTIPDTTFTATSGVVSAIAVQTDGKILLGTSSNPVFTNNPVRYNSDGSLDPTFAAAISSLPVSCLAIQTDGKIVAGGNATDHIHYVWRLNSNGSPDVSFSNSVPLLSGFLNCLAAQADGKIILGGGFTIGTSVIQKNLARLNPDGTLDSNFVADVNLPVSSLALQRDGTILISGSFTALGGDSHVHLGRLNSDGSVDTHFNPSISAGASLMLVQPDGKILVDASSTVSRFNADGTVDTNFNPFSAQSVGSLALQSDGKIVIGGSFSAINGITNYSRLARVDSDGTPDPFFLPSVKGSSVLAVALQSDGAILVGGQFTNVNGHACTNIARIIPPETASQSLSLDGDAITWQRTGSSPEFWRTTFETSPDGTNWAAVLPGSRISNGWQLAGVVLTGTNFVRARGFTVGGHNQSSDGYIENLAQLITPPGILVNDPLFGVHSNQFSFNVSAASGETLIVETSTNLQDWSALSTNILTNSTFYFADPGAASGPQRFYRLKLQ